MGENMFHRLVSVAVVAPEDGDSNSGCYQLSIKIPTLLFRRETFAWILVLFLNIWTMVSLLDRNSRNSTNYAMSIEQKSPIALENQQQGIPKIIPSITRQPTNNGTKTFQELSTGKIITRTFHGLQNELGIQEGYDALRDGNCWCTGWMDNFCSCTPSLAVDVIIRSGSTHLWLIEHKETGKVGCLGGFVAVGETTEEAVARLLREEIYLLLASPPQLFGVYGDPRRDRTSRHHHTISVVFIVDAQEENEQNQIPVILGDDKLDIVRVQLDALDRLDYFLDHKTIVKDYKKSIAGTSGISVDYGATFLYDRPVKRAICHQKVLKLSH
jgi:ADP-ribose pyrophosphatase YjhB (NUDIX family)